MQFSNSYVTLGDAFYQRIAPLPASNPKLLLWNHALAKQLAVAEPLNRDTDLQAQVFSGNRLPQGAEALALAYCGHQFGQLSPQLGDGRAHLLGEIIDHTGQRLDIQLKGSGRTRFSRGGDGRCALGPALREYIMSEAMHGLGVPTSRCLAVVASGDTVWREHAMPGAVVTRVAASHIRVGTFQYFAIRQDHESLKALMDYTIGRHYPQLSPLPDETNQALQLLQAVIAKQIALVVHWLRVGFIHGVMNTDNTAVSGETIDFGPCAMLGIYDPNTVYSSIDRQGRYAFGNQPNIVLWNMTRFAECLLPFVAKDEHEAVARVQAILQQLPTQFEHAYFTMRANKLGLSEVVESDRALLDACLQTLQEKQLDYTQSFIQLGQSLDDKVLAKTLTAKLGDWYGAWRQRLDKTDLSLAKQSMCANNPLVIPRNHHVENQLAEVAIHGVTPALDDFLKVLRCPYVDTTETTRYQDLPVDQDRGYRTFCGT